MTKTMPDGRPGIQLPSFKDVRARENKRAKVTSLFRSDASTSRDGTLPASAGPAQPGISSVTRNNGAEKGEGAIPQSSTAPISAAVDAAPARATQGVSSRPNTEAPGATAPYREHVTHGNAVLVNRNQQGNPLLKCLRNINYRFAGVIPDYLINDKIAVIFLSLKFHRLQPLYVHNRINALQRAYRTFLLCHCDVDDPEQPLAEVTKAAIDHHCSLITAFSALECARYIELLKLYESKTADSLKPRLEPEMTARVANVLSKIRAVNKTDCAAMGAEFGTVAAMLQADEQQLTSVPGLGPVKVSRMLAAFSTPFKRDGVSARPAAAPASSDGAAASGTPVSGVHSTGAVVSRQEAREWVATQEGRIRGDDEDADIDDLAA